MYWNYGCPKCHAQTSVQWRQREIEAACRACGEIHYPPTPHEDHYGWVDGAEWPAEMAQAVEVVRGTVCAVTGCYKQHETLVHRRSLKSGGRTSVDNLMPLCKSHAESKGTKEYDDWLFEAKEQAAAERMSAPKFEITITAAGSGQEATGTDPCRRGARAHRSPAAGPGEGRGAVPARAGDPGRARLRLAHEG
jgi:hypothetical protein